MRVDKVPLHMIRIGRYYMARAGVNALSYRKSPFSGGSACLDTWLPDTYTLPFALDGCNSSCRNYRKRNIKSR